MRSFLSALYAAIQSHKAVADIDAALSSGNVQHLLKMSRCQWEALLSNDISSTHKLLDGEVAASGLRKAGLEKQLEVEHAKTIALYEKATYDFANRACCSCQCLFKRSAITKVKFSDDLGSLWPVSYTHLTLPTILLV